MLQSLFGPQKDDICPNCGAACFAADMLCPGCGKSLDDLFEQLPTNLRVAQGLTVLPKEHWLLLTWVVANSIGLVLGKELLWPLILTLMPTELARSAPDLWDAIFWVVPSIVSGMTMGAAQWVILRPHLARSWRWIFATPLGMLGSSFIQSFFYRVIDFWPIDHLLNLFLYGAVIGLSQWLVLRKSFRHAWAWVLANGFGWAVAILIGQEVIRPRLYGLPAVGWIDYLPNPVYEVIIYLAIGAVVGTATGLLLLGLLRQNKRVGHLAA